MQEILEASKHHDSDLQSRDPKKHCDSISNPHVDQRQKRSPDSLDPSDARKIKQEGNVLDQNEQSQVLLPIGHNHHKENEAFFAQNTSSRKSQDPANHPLCDNFKTGDSFGNSPSSRESQSSSFHSPGYIEVRQNVSDVVAHRSSNIQRTSENESVVGKSVVPQNQFDRKHKYNLRSSRNPDDESGTGNQLDRKDSFPSVKEMDEQLKQIEQASRNQLREDTMNKIQNQNDESLEKNKLSKESKLASSEKRHEETMKKIQNRDNETPQKIQQADNPSEKSKKEQKSLQKQSKVVAEPTKEPQLKSYTHRHSDQDIEVTFEVLLSPEMSTLGNKVCIVFGPPLSDWETAMVEMKLKDPSLPLIEPEKYVYLSGVLPLNVNLKSKSIPYKYVVNLTQGGHIWEHIEVSNTSGGTFNRCLVVPDKAERRFTKFDDVILPKDIGRKSSASQLQRHGREVATMWMLPRPRDLENPDFDFELALERFCGVVKSHGNNGLKLCANDNPKGYLNPCGYKVESAVQIQLKKFFRRFEEFLKDNNLGKLLLTAVYLCLVGNTEHLEIKEKGQFMTFFEAFWKCRDLLFDPTRLPKSIAGEIQNKICASLKKLIQDFVNLPVNHWSTEDSSRGDWLYVVPFIHYWDLSGGKAGEWLRLEKWKQSLRTRYDST